MSLQQAGPAHLHPGLAASYYKPLKDSDVQRIAEAAMHLLETNGMVVYTPTGYDALKRAGAQADEATRIVRMPRSMVEDAIASNPSSVTLHGREERFHAVLEKNRVHYGTGGTAIYVLDPDTHERRPSTIDDVILNARMVQTLDNVHVFTINVFPHDVKDQNAIDPNRFFHALDNTTKHVMGGIYSLDGCKRVVEMAEMLAGGEEALRRAPFVSFITLIISPFKIDAHYGEMTCYLAGKGLPVVVPTEPICGTTSPITLAGNVLTHIAETLGGITMVQAVNRGAPGICGSVGSITNLSNMDHVGGAIERGMIHAAVSQMAQHFELPLYSTSGCSDTKEVDVQGGYESAMMSLLVAMSGANYIHDAAGLMEADLTVSYEKLAIDDEILGMCQRVLRGIEVTDETLAVELLKQKKPGEDFLAEMHTVEYMRNEFFTPTVGNRDKRDAYDPQHSAFNRARAFVSQIRGQEPVSCMQPEIRQQILSNFDELICV